VSAGTRGGGINREIVKQSRLKGSKKRTENQNEGYEERRKRGGLAIPASRCPTNTKEGGRGPKTNERTRFGGIISKNGIEDLVGHTAAGKKKVPRKGTTKDGVSSAEPRE